MGKSGRSDQAAAAIVVGAATATDLRRGRRDVCRSSTASTSAGSSRAFVSRSRLITWGKSINARSAAWSRRPSVPMTGAYSTQKEHAIQRSNSAIAGLSSWGSRQRLISCNGTRARSFFLAKHLTFGAGRVGFADSIARVDALTTPAGIHVHVGLETLTTMSRNMQPAAHTALPHVGPPDRLLALQPRGSLLPRRLLPFRQRQRLVTDRAYWVFVQGPRREEIAPTRAPAPEYSSAEAPRTQLAG